MLSKGNYNIASVRYLKGFLNQKYRRPRSGHPLFRQKVFLPANRENVDAHQCVRTVPIVFRDASRQYEVVLTCPDFGKQFSKLGENFANFFINM